MTRREKANRRARAQLAKVATVETEALALAEIAALPAEGFVEHDFYICDSRHRLAGLKGPPPVKAWTNQKYIAQLYLDSKGSRLSFQRTTASMMIRPKNRNREPLTWDELQNLKKELGYGHHWAVEIYPPEEHLQNVADMRHLWFVVEELVPFAWKSTEKNP